MKNRFRIEPLTIVLSSLVLLLVLTLLTMVFGSIYQEIDKEAQMMSHLLEKSAFIECSYQNASYDTELTYIALCRTEQKTSLLVVLDTDAKIIKRVAVSKEQISLDLVNIQTMYNSLSDITWTYQDFDLLYTFQTKDSRVYLNRSDLSLNKKVRLYDE